MRLLTALPLLALGSAPAMAASCPPVPNTVEERAGILSQLRVAPDQASAEALQDRLWRLWTRAPDAEAQYLLDTGMDRRDSYDFAGAMEMFDALVAYCPDYAEGWNQRAFVHFLRGNFDPALLDLHHALDLSPDHIAAQAGLAVTLLHMGRIEEGQAALKQALALNPWLPERGYLIPGAAIEGR